MTDTTLTIAEERRLSKHEATIRAGKQHFLAVGRALIAIKEGRLYRNTHEDFESYCKDTHGFAKSRMYQIMGAVEVADSLPDSTVVENERQARALAEVPIAQRAEVFEAAVEESPSGKPTARKIAETAARLAPEPEPEYESDEGDEPVAQAVAPREPNIIGARKEEFRDWWQSVLTDPPRVAAYLRTFIAEETA